MRPHVRPLWLVILGTATISAGVSIVLAQEQHAAGVQAKVTYANGTSRTGLIPREWVVWYTAEETEMRVYIDALKSIRVTERPPASVTAPEARRFGFAATTVAGSVINFRECRDLLTELALNREDGIQEMLYVGNQSAPAVERIEFLGTARTDRNGNVMFAQWRYSPFTGEKLPTSQ